MATIKLCDWTKERIGQDETTYIFSIDGKDFEVGESGKKMLLEQLEGEDAIRPAKPAAPPVPPKPKEPAPPQLMGATPGSIQIEVKEDAFDSGPSSEPIAPQAAPQPPVDPADVDREMQLEIPDDPNKRLSTPSAKLAQKIIEEATVAEPGTLDALTRGNKKQLHAARQLKALEDKAESELRRKTPGGVKMTDARDRQGYYED